MLTTYNVHLNAVVHIKVGNVTANSMEEAAELVANGTNFHELCQRNSCNSGDFLVEYAEYAEEIVSATVDVCDDEDFVDSRNFHFSGGWKPGNQPRVLVTVTGGVATTVADTGVDVCVFDFDEAKVNSEYPRDVPELFRDMNQQDEQL